MGFLESLTNVGTWSAALDQAAEIAHWITVLNKILTAVEKVEAFLTNPIVIAVGVALWLFLAFDVFSLARRRGVPAPWLAWLPIAHSWETGSIADRARLARTGQRTVRRGLLLGFSLLLVILTAVAVVLTSRLMDKVYSSAFELLVFQSKRDELLEQAIITGISWIPVLVILIARTVIYAITLFEVYRSCEPDYAALYTVMSILLPPVLPMILFCVRKKDRGLPALLTE